MSTLKTNTLSNVDGTASTAIENAINGSAKAWVNFNGRSTVAIRAAYNVTSITDNGTGDYTLNFTNAFSDTNYALVGTGCTFYGTYRANVTIRLSGNDTIALYSTTQARINTENAQIDSLADPAIANVSVFR